MIHDDGTMDVMVGDVIERRRIADVHMVIVGEGREVPSMYRPETADGETVVQSMGTIPRIVRTRP